MDLQIPSQACHFCLRVIKSSEDGQLRRCKACRNALYCSRECQVKAWKQDHKITCGEIAQLRELSAKGSDRAAHTLSLYSSMNITPLQKDLNAWIWRWNARLAEVAVSALDLGHHPERITTHSVFVLVEARLDQHPRSPFRFRVKEGKIISPFNSDHSEEEFLDLLYPGSRHDWKQHDQDGTEFVRMCIAFDGLCCFEWLRYDPDTMKGASPELYDWTSRHWVELMKGLISEAKPEEVRAAIAKNSAK